MKVSELYKYLDGAIPSSLSCEWDNDGFMCSGDTEKEVKRVLIALDITERIIQRAIEGNFNVIISHHPMIFSKIGAVEPSVISAKKAITIIKNDISAMSFHTRLDSLCGGVNDVLCERIGLKDAVPFGPEGEAMGRIGFLGEPMEAEDFCEKVKMALGAPIVLCAPSGKKVCRVALLGGSGKSFVDYAISAGADTYLSGRLDYNIMAEAFEMGINLIEAGHYFTEAPVCEFLSELVKKADPEIYTEIISSNEIKVI